MPETTTQTHEEKAPDPVRKTVPAWLVTVIILLLAVAIFFMVYGNWNSWQSNRTSQETNDAYVHADITAVSTKAAGILQDLPVSDYQHVKKGQLLATIRSDDYQTQVSGAKAALDGTVAGLDEVRRQKEIADAKIAQATAGVTAAEGQVSAAKAGIDAAKASVRTADAGVSAAAAQLKNAQEERERAEGLYAVRATTLQKIQNVQAQATSAQALSDSRQSDRLAAQAQLELRTADLQRAQAGLISSRQDLRNSFAQQALGGRQRETDTRGDCRPEFSSRRRKDWARVHHDRSADGWLHRFPQYPPRSISFSRLDGSYACGRRTLDPGKLQGNSVGENARRRSLGYQSRCIPLAHLARHCRGYCSCDRGPNGSDSAEQRVGQLH